jgi:hypothetical protein
MKKNVPCSVNTQLYLLLYGYAEYASRASVAGFGMYI